MTILSINDFVEGLMDISKGFLEIHNKYKKTAELDFGVGIAENNNCNTIACHAGWAAILNYQNKELQDGTFYAGGIKVIENRLGFQFDYGFEEWARDNSKLWGNKNGSLMFKNYGYTAFGFNRNNKHNITLLDVAEWYYQVARRVLIEAKKRKASLTDKAFTIFDNSRHEN